MTRFFAWEIPCKYFLATRYTGEATLYSTMQFSWLHFLTMAASLSIFVFWALPCCNWICENFQVSSILYPRLFYFSSNLNIIWFLLLPSIVVLESSIWVRFDLALFWSSYFCGIYVQRKYNFEIGESHTNAIFFWCHSDAGIILLNRFVSNRLCSWHV